MQITPRRRKQRQADRRVISRGRRTVAHASPGAGCTLPPAPTSRVGRAGKTPHIGQRSLQPARKRPFITDLKAFRPESWLNTRAITQTQDPETLFRLRYQVYCREQGFLNPEHYPDGLERDAFDDHSGLDDFNRFFQPDSGVCANHQPLCRNPR